MAAEKSLDEIVNECGYACCECPFPDCRLSDTDIITESKDEITESKPLTYSQIKYRANREKNREYARKYYAEHKEEFREYKKAYRKRKQLEKREFKNQKRKRIVFNYDYMMSLNFTELAKIIVGMRDMTASEIVDFMADIYSREDFEQFKGGAE